MGRAERERDYPSFSRATTNEAAMSRKGAREEERRNTTQRSLQVSSFVASFSPAMNRTLNEGGRRSLAQLQFLQLKTRRGKKNGRVLDLEKKLTHTRTHERKGEIFSSTLRGFVVPIFGSLLSSVCQIFLQFVDTKPDLGKPHQQQINFAKKMCQITCYCIFVKKW